jgi:lysophospholipase L1-like esterase
MSEDIKTQSNMKNPECNVSRRQFFRQSGAAVLATTLLSSCGVIEDIFPKGEKDRDNTLAFFGDSLTIGAGGTTPYGSVVAAALGRPVLSDGIVGQMASQIAVRQGGTPLTITIEGNKLNGITPVKITKLSSLFLTTTSNSFEYSRTGTVGGVRCTIRRTANAEQGEIYTITPATVSVIDVAAGSEFVLEDANRLRTATQVLWYGRNNIGMADAESQILTSLEKSISHIDGSPRYVIVGVLLASTDNKGTAKYNQVKGINDKLASKYGKSFVEMTPPTEAEMAAIGYTPTSDDQIDLNNLNFPRGMRADFKTDDIHLNDKGYKIIANRVIDKLKELKY